MSGFGDSLKVWRKKRSLSQLELSMAAEVSSKHISFLETGRASPSREMVLHLAQALEIPLAERNVLLHQSGFTEAYTRNSLDESNMQPVKNALDLILQNHNPYPAFVFDWDWNIILMNKTQETLLTMVQQAQTSFPDTRNILDLLFDPNGYRPFVKNWENVAYHLLMRVKSEQQLHQDRQSNLLERLYAYPDVPKQWQHSTEPATTPMLTLEMTLGDITLTFFSTLATFGTPIDITLQELTIEQYFPADDFTQSFLTALAN